ncbi:MAG: glycosyltransferase [Pseudomonadota bacterium]
MKSAGRPLKPQRIVGIVRYSLLLERGNFFPAAADVAPEDFARRILDPKRLERRFQMFSEVCLPSLAAQTDRDFNVVLVTSRLLPRVWIRRLERLLAKTDNVRLRVFRAESNISRVHRRAAFEVLDTEADAVATFRLDDDDALSRDFIATLRQFTTPAYTGHAITFVPGYELVLTGAEMALKINKRQKASAGLATITTGPFEKAEKLWTVYTAGAHRQIDKVAPLEVVEGPPRFLQTAHGFNVSERSGGWSNEPASAAEIAAEIREGFPALTADRLARLHALCRVG